MKTQGARFRFIREKLGLSKTEFAKALDIPASLESVIESGGREASRDILVRLANRYRVNLNWYLSGDGESAIPDSPGTETAGVPLVLQEAAAGRGIEIDDYAETRTVPVPGQLLRGLNPANLKAVTVRGDSMVGREIFDGDIVIFNPLDTDSESISVVSVAGQLLVKHVSVDRLADTVTLTSANAMYPPRVISGSDLSGVKIEGKLVACLHRM